MNNSEFLWGLMKRADGSLQAWFDAEHVESGPTNGIDGETNGIAGEITLPDGDAMDMLRKWIANHDPHLRGHGLSSLEGIADMVKRDYVRRSDYDFTVEMLNCMKAERDELKAMNDRLQVALDAVEGCDERCKKLEAERDEAIEAYDKHMEAHDAWHEPEDIKYTRNRFSVLEKAKNERIAKLEAERDEWKAKAEHYGGHVDRLMEAIRDLARKQPWTFDPEAPYKNAELVGKYIDELKAKAEIAERAMDAQPDGNGTCPDAMGQSSDVPTLGDLFGVLGDEEPHGEPDSREKLEADIEKRAVHAETILGPLRIGTVKVGTNVIHGWLDRQASITERDVRTYLNREDSELIQAKVDNLQEQVEHLYVEISKRDVEIAKRDKGIERLKRQRDEARAELENLATDLAECSREREIYRDACGQLLDLADQMRLVSLDGCGATIVDERGEVVS